MIILANKKLLLTYKLIKRKTEIKYQRNFYYKKNNQENQNKICIAGIFAALGICMISEHKKNIACNSPFLLSTTIRSSSKHLLTNPLHRDIGFLQLIGAYSILKWISNHWNPKQQVQTHSPVFPSFNLSDFSGQDKAKQDILEMVEFVKNSEKYESMGAHLPKGILLTGPPGTGKTLLAQAFAGEAGLNFYPLAASELMGKWVGSSAENVRNLFDCARKNAPALIFIDEVDAIGCKRVGNPSDEREAALNQLLSEIDGVGINNKVIVMAATNLKSKLDDALLRPGRFDRIIDLALPDFEGRAEILRTHLAKLRLEQAKANEFSKHISSLSSGLTGADLANICNEAAIRAAKMNKKDVEIDDIEYAAEKISASKSTDTVGFNNFKSKNDSSNPILFKDVAGQDDAKIEIREVIEFLKNPDKFKKIGAHMPKGLLLIGPPGTGKTLFAKASAGEAGVPFFAKSGSEFIEMFVGVGALRVRELFQEARKASPSIIFIDEIDSIGGKRKNNAINNSEAESTLNQLLVEMDGFKQANVIVIGATNRKDMMDPALLRPGRFDRIVELKLPDFKSRVAILRLHLKKFQLDSKLTMEKYAIFIAEKTEGFSGAELANLCNEAAILAIRSEKEKITTEEFLKSIQKTSSRYNV